MLALSIVLSFESLLDIITVSTYVIFLNSDSKQKEQQSICLMLWEQLFHVVHEYPLKKTWEHRITLSNWTYYYCSDTWVHEFDIRHGVGLISPYALIHMIPVTLPRDPVTLLGGLETVRLL